MVAGLTPFFVAKPGPVNPDMVKYEECGVAMVGDAGPLSYLLMAAAAGLVFRFFGNDFSTVINNILILFTEVNVGFFVFNMIPFPPLDGSRLLYAFAPEPLQNFMRQIESIGFLVIIFVIFVLFQFGSGSIFTFQHSLANRLLGLEWIAVGACLNK